MYILCGRHTTQFAQSLFFLLLSLSRKMSFSVLSFGVSVVVILLLDSLHQFNYFTRVIQVSIFLLRCRLVNDLFLELFVIFGGFFLFVSRWFQINYTFGEKRKEKFRHIQTGDDFQTNFFLLLSTHLKFQYSLVSACIGGNKQNINHAHLKHY